MNFEEQFEHLVEKHESLTRILELLAREARGLRFDAGPGAQERPAGDHEGESRQ